MEGRNEKALAVYSRVQKKLTGNIQAMKWYHTNRSKGRDFDPETELSVNDQVEKLIIQATAVENLCQCFLGTYCAQFAVRRLTLEAGWCAFW